MVPDLVCPSGKMWFLCLAVCTLFLFSVGNFCQMASLDNKNTFKGPAQLSQTTGGEWRHRRDSIVFGLNLVQTKLMATAAGSYIIWFDWLIAILQRMGCSSCKINNDSDGTDYFIDMLAFNGNFKKLIKKVNVAIGNFQGTTCRVRLAKQTVIWR